MPKQRAPFDYERYQELKAQGGSQRDIAKAMGIAERTLRDNLKVMQKAQASYGLPQDDLGLAKGPPQGDQGTPKIQPVYPTEADQGSAQGLPQEDQGIPLPEGSLGPSQPDQAETAVLADRTPPTPLTGGPKDTEGGPQGTPEDHQGTPPLYVHPGIPDDGQESPVGSETIEGVHEGIPAIPLTKPREESHGAGPEALSPQRIEALTAALPDLLYMVAWWRERQRCAQEPSAKLERVTYHVAPKWIEAVKHEADLTHESYAAVVNRAFAQYFARKST